MKRFITTFGLASAGVSVAILITMAAMAFIAWDLSVLEPFLAFGLVRYWLFATTVMTLAIFWERS